MNDAPSFTLEPPDLDWSTETVEIDLNNTEYAKEIKASTFARLRCINRFFRAWKGNSRAQRNAKVNEILGIRWRIDLLQRKFFRKWKLMQRGAAILIRMKQTRDLAGVFRLWSKFVSKKRENEEKFDELCERQQILAQKNALKEWKRVLALKRKYLWYSEHDDFILGKRIVSAFFCYLAKLDLWRRATVQIAENAKFSRLSMMFFKWRRTLKMRRITKIYLRMAKRRVLTRFVGVWRSNLHFKVVRRKRIRVFLMRRRMLMLTKAFDRWIDKLESVAGENERRVQVEENAVFHATRDAWTKWTRAFHLSVYGNRMESELKRALNYLTLQRVFGYWFNFYEEHSVEAEMLCNATEEIRYGLMNRVFERWWTRFDLAVKTREDVAHLRKVLDKSLLKRKFVDWRGKFFAISRNRGAYEKSMRFRKLMLENKAFQTLQACVARRKRDECNTASMKSVSGKYVMRRGFRFWKKQTIKYSRRKFLIRSVLRSWARSVQKRAMERWSLYIEHRRAVKSEYLNARDAFHGRRIAHFIQAFIQGAPVFPIEAPSVRQSEPVLEQEWQDDSSSHGVDVIEGPILAQPKRPSFLSGPISQRPDDQIVSMERRLNTIIHTGCSNREQRTEMVQLIRMLNKLRGKPEANV